MSTEHTAGSQPLPRPEFSHPVDVRQTEGYAPLLVASEAERAALAKRFGLVSIARLEAQLELHRKDRVVNVTGQLVADFIQPCAVSAEEVPVSIDEPLELRFVPAGSIQVSEDELEIDLDACDEIEYEGSHIDLGEAVAQSVALAIDPYLTGPNADAARKAAGISAPEDNSPFAALKGLKTRD